MSGGDHEHSGHGKSKKHHAHEEHEEHVNHEAWVIPYADLLTLLLAMFLALYATSQADQSKRDAIANAARQELSAVPFSKDGGSGDPSIIQGGAANPLSPETQGPSASNLIDPGISTINEQAAKALSEKQARAAEAAVEGKVFDSVEQQLRQAAAAAGVLDALSFKREERGLVVSVVSDRVLFPSGGGSMLASGQDIIDKLADALRATGKPIAIEGHTDSRPISTPQFASNWELSTSRATSVLRYLIDVRGFDPALLTASGYADTKPLQSNDTPEGRDRNRRVEIVVLSTLGK